ncbi:WW domain-binding protein 11, partial [Galemys pyrenaicus]
REFKKNKKQCMMVRAAVLKMKDPKPIIQDMEKLDEMEFNPVQQPQFNEKVLKDKRKKLQEEDMSYSPELAQHGHDEDASGTGEVDGCPEHMDPDKLSDSTNDSDTNRSDGESEGDECVHRDDDRDTDEENKHKHLPCPDHFLLDHHLLHLYSHLDCLQVFPQPTSRSSSIPETPWNGRSVRALAQTFTSRTPPGWPPGP